MNEVLPPEYPAVYEDLAIRSRIIGFSMPSDAHTGCLLKTLVASKRKGHFLELGTGTGLSLSWMIEGMCTDGQIITIDNNSGYLAIAEAYFGHDPRVKIFESDGAEWISQNGDQTFDLIFADTWPGKYSHLEEVLKMVRPGGFYVVDDMLKQPNWPVGHAEKAANLGNYLQSHDDFSCSTLNWSTGIIIATRTK